MFACGGLHERIGKLSDFLKLLYPYVILEKRMASRMLLLSGPTSGMLRACSSLEARMTCLADLAA